MSKSPSLLAQVTAPLATLGAGGPPGHRPLSHKIAGQVGRKRYARLPPAEYRRLRDITPMAGWRGRAGGVTCTPYLAGRPAAAALSQPRERNVVASAGVPGSLFAAPRIVASQ